MALNSTISNLKNMIEQISHDLTKAESGNKAAAQRVRTTTVRFEKVAKAYRKESIASEKTGKGPKKSAKKASKPAAKAKKPSAPAKKPAAAKPKSALAKPRALAFKKPTAKLPLKRAGSR